MKEHVPQINELIEALLYFRSDMKQYVQKKIRENEFDITYEMLQVLGVLWIRGERNQQQIANRLQKNKASLTSLIDNLEKRGLLRRSEDAHDRRNKIISLTPMGQNYRQRAQPLLDNFFNTVQQEITHDDLHKVLTILTKMRGNLRNG